MLDAQLRLFMRADFEGVEPPAGQYARVERLISHDEEVAGNLPIHASLPSSRPFLPSLTSDMPTSPFRASKPSGRFYRFLTGTASARLLPGGIALTVMMMVLGANVSQLLNGEVGPLYTRTNPITIVEWDPQDVPPQVPHASPRDSLVEPPVVTSEIIFPDPAEVRSPALPVAFAPTTHQDIVPMPSEELRPE
ncbi:MAG TPA: hypothetical protein VGE45_04775 [Chloroflexia bacterium]